MARDLSVPRWPDGADVAVSITFDVDAEAGWLNEGEQYAQRLTILSEARFGVVRGVPRILELLADLEIPGTFYVPGETVERHTKAIEPIVAAGHEIGHHGYLHYRSDRVDAGVQREEIERGLEALESRISVKPSGYRSASWELTPETLALLFEHGFEYDSSLMADDRPYLEELDGRTIVELPVHWTLDDWPFFAWTIDSGGNMTNARDFEQVWLDEFDSALRDRRHITYTMHPEVIGRGHRIAALRRVLEQMRARGKIWFATHHEVVEHLKAAV